MWHIYRLEDESQLVADEVLSASSYSCSCAHFEDSHLVGVNLFCIKMPDNKSLDWDMLEAQELLLTDWEVYQFFIFARFILSWSTMWGVAMQASESKFFYGYRRKTLDRCKKNQPSKVENLGSTSSSSLTQELLACCYCWKQIALNVVGCFNETQFAATGYPMIIAELQSDEVCLWFLKQIWGKKFVENLRVQCVGKIL
jgi:hypothetical protein